tara:strand:- start:412 stop:1626 length:1215 start_codon:yes stop_codon:yes gene_type:complete
MKINSLMFVLICSCFLFGCPNHYEKIEQAYYNDQFFLTVQLSESLITTAKFKKSIKKKFNHFITQNGDYLLEKLETETEMLISNGPSIEIYFLFYKTYEQLQQIHLLYPDVIKSSFLQRYFNKIESYATKTIADQRYRMQTAYEAKLYRHVVKYVQNLEKVDKASSDDEKLKEDALAKAKRVLTVNKIEAFDHNINEGLKKDKKNHLKTMNPHSLTRYGVNIPKLMYHYAITDLSKHLTEFVIVESTLSAKSHYQLNLKVSMSEDESVLPKIVTEKSIFAYKKEDDSQWYRDEFEYDVSVLTKQINVIVNAEIVLSKTNEVVADFFYETLAESKIKSVGEFKDIPLNVSIVEYPIEYKSYQVKQEFNKNEDLLLEALKDAVTVLTVKVANTIDIDLDPWLLKAN